MTVIRPNSVSGINSITAQANEIKIFKSDGTQGGLVIGGANLNATSGISTVAALTVTGNVSVGGTLTYQDVTNIDSVGIITARAGINISGGNLEVGGDQVLNGHLDMRDSDRIRLGGSDELQIFHNGTHNFIDASGSTTDLYVRGANILLQDHANSNRNWLIGLADGSLRLHHAGNLKLETTTTGATITNDLVLNHASGDKAIRWATGGTNKWSLYHNNSAGALVAYDNANNAERLRIDSDGNMGLGVTPIAPGSLALHLGETTASQPVRLHMTTATTGATASDGFTLSIDGSSSDVNFIQRESADLLFYTSNTLRAKLLNNGYFQMGSGYLGSTGYHRFNGINNTQGQTFFVLSGYQGSGGASGDTAIFNSCNTGASVNSSSSAMLVYRNSSTTRSINASGTINASGADYAEYMTKAGNFTLAKGDVCGINSEGKLTNVFADAISFVVKSTDPSYVGGDKWHEVAGEQPGGYDDTRTEEEIAAAKVVYEEALESARQLVDRIAFSGQVPVNVTGATPGQHIIPTAASDGSIEGTAKAEADLTMAEYMSSVGKVIAIEDDGRARIIVKVA